MFVYVHRVCLHSERSALCISCLPRDAAEPGKLQRHRGAQQVQQCQCMQPHTTPVIAAEACWEAILLNQGPAGHGETRSLTNYHTSVIGCVTAREKVAHTDTDCDYCEFRFSRSPRRGTPGLPRRPSPGHVAGILS
jgi:hypothetical protein